MSNISISKKILMQIVGMTLVVLLIAIFILKYLQNNLIEDISKDDETKLTMSIQAKIDEKLNMCLVGATSIASDARVKEALKANDRNIAIPVLQDIEKHYKETTEWKKVKMHIHTKNNHSFIRHWKLDKFGDDLSGFRATVVEVNKSKIGIKALEVGQAGLELRGIAPIVDNGEHLGSIEFMLEYSTVVDELKKSNVDVLVLMNKDLSGISKLANNTNTIGNYILTLDKYNQKLADEIKALDLAQLKQNGYITTNNFFISMQPIKDYSKKDIGVYILAEDITEYNHTVDASTQIIKASITIMVILSAVILLGVIITIKLLVLKPINSLQESISHLSNSGDTSHRISIHSLDEIGLVAQTFNNYLENIDNGAKIDQIVINEVANIVNQAKQGMYAYVITSTAHSKSVEQLKNDINSMIISTRDNLNEISKVLISYGNSNFLPTIDNNETGGIIGSLEMSTAAIGTSVSELLCMIKVVSDELHYDTDELAKISDRLSHSANQQASSLEETSAAVEQITSAIKSTAQKAMQMDMIATNLKNSAMEGNKLSTQTADAMDEINKSTTAIHEAINIIDQIAFQTNILSLNAAVEAATAGEAGRGFAVVAGEVRNLANRSSEAAKEIKRLVDEAQIKANEGKTIAGHMRDGFVDLNNKILETSTLVDDVTNASKEQMQGMEQINKSISELDTATQENAEAAAKVSAKAEEVNAISDRLIKTTKRATFKEEYVNRVCDIDLVFDTTKLKLDHLLFKNSNFDKLASGERFNVNDHHNCALGKWMDAHKHIEYAQTQEWKQFEAKHKEVHDKVQEYINISATNKYDTKLTKISITLEEDIKNVFDFIDNLKESYCREKKAKSTQQSSIIQNSVVSSNNNKPKTNDEKWENF